MRRFEENLFFMSKSNRLNIDYLRPNLTTGRRELRPIQIDDKPLIGAENNDRRSIQTVHCAVVVRMLVLMALGKS